MSNAARCPDDMVLIPSGSFLMGSKDWDEDERPVRKRSISAFCLDVHEATKSEYDAYLSREQISSYELAQKDNKRGQPSARNVPERFAGPDQPANYIRWADAKGYCEWLKKRLPTEAEWEYAARAGRKEADFPDGVYATDTGRLERRDGTLSGWNAHYYADVTAEVCSYPKNPFGLCDMSGNVWEWVAGWYQETYEDLPGEERKGAATGKHRVLRGGSFDYAPPGNLRAANRNPAFKYEYWLGTIGVRCAADPVGGS